MNESSSPPSTHGAPALRWLGLGAAIGLIAAGWGLLERSSPDTPLPEGAVARVNDRVIPAHRYEGLLATTSSQGREPSQDDGAQILAQLIDEELLVQRGIELGMAESENTVRAAIVASLIASVTAEADAADPTDEQLRDFMTKHGERYTYATAMAINAWVTDDEWAARDFVTRLRENDATDNADGVRRVPGLPTAALPLERLRMFVGPAIAAAAFDMPENASAVFARQGRWYVVHVVRHEQSALAELDAVRSQVLLDYRRSLADARLRDYLNDLRAQANVQVAQP